MRILSSAAAPQSAVCEALNLSLRPTPAISPTQFNGSTTTTTTASLPASVSIQRRHQRSLYRQHHALQTPPPPPPVVLCARQHHHHHQLKYEDDVEYEEKVHPDIVCAVAVGTATTCPDAQLYNASSSAAAAADSAMDLACTSDKKPFSANEFPCNQVSVTFAETVAASGGGGVAPLSTPVYKTKVYPCPECLKVFRHPMSLHHHRHVHKGTYTCQSCGKVFSRRWDLHRHIHRSKMGCRRPPNHAAMTIAHSTSVVISSSTTSPTTPPPPPPIPSAAAAAIATAAVLRPDHPYDLNNPPSN